MQKRYVSREETEVSGNAFRGRLGNGPEGNGKMARWLPSFNEFFFSLGRLIQNCEEQLNSASCDTSEFLFRRLDEYERTLSTLISRFGESFGHLQSQQNCLANLSHLLRRTSFLRAHFERHCFLQTDEEEIQEPSTAQVESHDLPGRPRFAVSREQLEALHRDCGFRWSDIARTLGLSDRTLRRRRHEFGMRVEGREFSAISDIELDAFIRNILIVTPAAGLRMVQGSLRQHGYVVQRVRVLHSLRRVDPVTSTLRNARRIIRRSYNVACPNSLW